MAVEFKRLLHVYTPENNTHTFTDSIINDNSVIEVYTDNDDIYPTNISQSGNNVTVELIEHNVPINVCITINNVISFEPTSADWDDISNKPFSNILVDGGLVVGDDNLLVDINNYLVWNGLKFGYTPEGETRVTKISAIDLVERVNNKQDKLIPGDNISIVNNVISSTSHPSIDTYHANWVASSVSNTTTPLTGDLIVPKGKYLVLAHTPYASAVNSRFPFMIKVNNTDALDCIRFADTTYGQIMCVVNVTSDNSNIRLFSATGDTSVTWNSAYHNRGGLDAIKIG